MNKWNHTTNREWLQARRQCITATELAGFVSSFKRSKPATRIKMAGLWAEKMSVLPPDPSSPSSEAARGHCLEPFAIEDLNREAGSNYYHWDDCIIIGERGVGFSPDAMDIPQALDSVMLCVKDNKLTDCDGNVLDMPCSIVEVKSYGVKNHVATSLSAKEKCDERWQIAVAMMILPSIEFGYLELYCPPINEIVVKKYSRDDLKEEIDTLQSVLDFWLCCVQEFESGTSYLQKYKTHYTEQEIYETTQGVPYVE